MTESRVEYDSNNSGGRWWLKDGDWYALEKAGWKIHWIKDSEAHASLGVKDDGRFLGALASSATLYGAKSLKEAADSWSQATGKSPFEVGCQCCGQPHTFTLYVDDKYKESGPNISYDMSFDA